MRQTLLRSGTYGGERISNILNLYFESFTRLSMKGLIKKIRRSPAIAEKPRGNPGDDFLEMIMISNENK